jgi:hypothetical protein
LALQGAFVFYCRGPAVRANQQPRSGLAPNCFLFLQFWNDLSSPDVDPAAQADDPILPAEPLNDYLKPRVEGGGGLRQPLVQQPVGDPSASPFYLSESFFTASAPAGYTSVPALLICVYILRKVSLENIDIVGDYQGPISPRSRLLTVVMVLTFVFVLIPWIVRFVVFFNTRPSPNPPACIVFPSTHPICSHNDPVSWMPALDVVFFVLNIFVAAYFQTCTNIILSTSIDKACPTSV